MVPGRKGLVRTEVAGASATEGMDRVPTAWQNSPDKARDRDSTTGAHGEPATGWRDGRTMPETVTSLGSLLLLGLLLGFRHATDADHVIAIATIVSRQRTLRGSALIGAAWGVGHTLTILAVGGAIILFGVVIPPRLGLAVELAAGGMLVLLGLLTLTGMGRVIRTAATPYAGGLLPALSHTHDHPHAHGDYVHRHSHGHGDREHGHGEDQTPFAAL